MWNRRRLLTVWVSLCERDRMTERELTKRAKRRLTILRRVEEVTGNVAETCRYYGISRMCSHLEAPLRRTWPRRAQGPVLASPLQPASHRHRGRREDHLPAKELKLRDFEDLDVSQAVPRLQHLKLRCPADPQTVGPGPEGAEYSSGLISGGRCIVPGRCGAFPAR